LACEGAERALQFQGFGSEGAGGFNAAGEFLLLVNSTRHL
jgi:hypothetical protein